MRVGLYYPLRFNNEGFRELQGLEREAFTQALEGSRTPEEVDEFVLWEDPKRYATAYRRPNTEVGRRYNFNNHHTTPRFAVATEGSEIIGFGYSTQNVSGGGPPEGPQNNSLLARGKRRAKRLSVERNYLAVAKIVVKPERQGQGVGRSIAESLVEAAWPLRQVATYIWPDEIEFVEDALVRVGFEPTGEQNVRPFGENRPAVRQVRMQGARATILENLRKPTV